MKENILVTGAAGFIGSHLVDELIKQNYHVIGIDDLSGGYRSNVNSKCDFHQISVNDTDQIEVLFRALKPKVVYHASAYAAEGLSHFIKKFNYENNLIGSINIINECVKNDVKRIVFFSSMAVYGTNRTPMSEDLPRMPEDSYGISKAAVEQELEISNKMFGLDYCIIRPHNIYGEKQNIWDPYRNVIGIWMNRIMMNKPPLIFGDGTQTRAFSYIGDIIPSLVRAGFDKKISKQIINLGASKPCSLNELAEQVCTAMNTSIKPIHVEERYEVKHAHCTTEKSRKLLGFQDKTTLEEGLRRMAEWAKTQTPKEGKKWEKLELTKNLPSFWRT